MTDVRKMFDKNYIYSYDLEGKDRTVTIERVEGGELTGIGGVKTRKPVLFFEKMRKGMGLNITNARVIAGLYGGFDSEKWLGKRITLFATTTQFGGKEVECIRVRPRIPGTKAEPIREDVPPPAGEPVGDVEPTGVDPSPESVTVGSAQ